MARIGYLHTFFYTAVLFVQTACATTAELTCDKDLANNFLDNIHVGRSKDVFSAIKRCAEQGNVLHQTILGYFYTYKDKNPYYNYKTGIEWHRKAASHGAVEAQFMCAQAIYLGRLRVDDEVIQKAYYKEAFEWYRKAADQGHPDALLRLGEYYDSRTLDTETAYFWYLLADRKFKPSSISKRFPISNMKKMLESKRITTESIERATIRADQWEKEHPNVPKIWPSDDWIENF